MLVRLLYASRAQDALDAEELQSILRRSQAYNAAHGITGVLCLAGGQFVQALEGGRQAVNRLYLRIAADRRHADPVLLSYEEIAERRFAGWAMGQVNMARLNPALLLRHSETATLDAQAMSGRAMLALFDEIVASAAIVCERG